MSKPNIFRGIRRTIPPKFNSHAHLEKATSKLNKLSTSYVSKLPSIIETIKTETKEAVIEPFPGYTDGLKRSLLDRSKGTIYRELPLSEKLLKSLNKQCPLCPGHPITSIIPGLNELVETNVELLTRFINSRGMILSRKSTGTCAKHQRKLASIIKRSRHLGFLSFTRGPDDFFNLGAPSFDNIWLEYGDNINPVHREYQNDGLHEQLNKDPTRDLFGQLKTPWQIDTTKSRHSEMPILNDTSLAKLSGQPINNIIDNKYRPPTFHMIRLAIGQMKPRPRPKIRWVDGKPIVDLIKPKYVAEDHEPIRDAHDMFGVDEVYMNEAELLGKPMPHYTRRQQLFSAHIQEAINNARSGKLEKVEDSKRPWVAQLEIERERLQLAMEVERVSKLENPSENLDWENIAAAVQEKVSQKIDFGIKKKASKADTSKAL